MTFNLSVIKKRLNPAFSAILKRFLPQGTYFTMAAMMTRS